MTLIDILREVECGNVSPDQAQAMIVEAATSNVDGRKKVEQGIASRIVAHVTTGILYWRNQYENAPKDDSKEGLVSRVAANAHIDALQEVHEKITGSKLP